MTHHKLEVENDQNDETELELVFAVIVVVLDAEDDEENTMIKEVAHEQIQGLVDVFAPLVNIHGQLGGECLSCNLLVFWSDLVAVLIS